MTTIWMDAGRPKVYPWFEKYAGLPLLIFAIWYFPWWYGAIIGYIAGGIASGFWWFTNDEDADKGFVWRYIRNNSMNFKRFVIGVSDHGHWVTGTEWDPSINLRSDVGMKGWLFSVIWIGPLPILPFASYSGSIIEGYIGWQPWGEFAIKLTRADGKGWQLW